MRETNLGDLNQYYSRGYTPDNWNRSTKVWLVDLHESYLSETYGPHPGFAVDAGILGMPAQIIDEATDMSQNWVGWGFYTHNTKDSVYSNIPVLLFAKKEDALMARLRWTGSPWLTLCG